MNVVYRARVVVPVDRPPIDNGFVRVAGGRIADVGVWPPSRRGGAAVDLGDVALLPGFVNAHAHLELTDYAGHIEPCDLWAWIPQLVRLRAQPGQADRERQGVRHGASLSLAAGVTAIGDISRTHQAWPALRGTGLRAVCFAELLSFADAPARTPDELAAKVRETPSDIDVTPGLSPHAPYSVTAAQLRACVELARREHRPLAMHVAETREERQFIEQGDGPIRDFLAAGGYLDAHPSPRRPLFEHLGDAGLFDMPSLLVHVNYVSDSELDVLARSSCSVAHCPRAHRWFGHEHHRFRDMLARGINVCVGTDSLASNESLSVLDELRFLRAAHGDMPPDVILSMGTIRAARALGLAGQAGSITPGKRADLVAVPIDPATAREPARAVLESRQAPISVCRALPRQHDRCT